MPELIAKMGERLRRSRMGRVVLHDLAVNLFKDGLGLAGGGKDRSLCHVRLQSARCCIPAGKGR
jgi:hypothetical protein